MVARGVIAVPLMSRDNAIRVASLETARVCSLAIVYSGHMA